MQARKQKNDRNDQQAVNLAFAELGICWQQRLFRLTNFVRVQVVVEAEA
jgi:hypothetical protein